MSTLGKKKENLYNFLPVLDRIYCNGEEAALATSKPDNTCRCV